jgi:hypothetical protein
MPCRRKNRHIELTAIRTSRSANRSRISSTALVQLLRRTIDDSRYPLSPRLAPLKGDPAEARSVEA